MAETNALGKATQTVLEQAEVLCKDWAGLAA
jgi:hypothetical protein